MCVSVRLCGRSPKESSTLSTGQVCSTSRSRPIIVNMPEQNRKTGSPCPWTQKRMGRHHWLLNQIYQVNRVSMKRARTPEESVPDHPTSIALMQDKPHANFKAEFARYGFTWDRS